MRILVESPNCNAFAGSNAAVGWGWISRLAERHEVFAVVSAARYDVGHPGERAPRIPNLTVVRVPRSPLRRVGTLTDFVANARRMRDDLIERIRPDVVHSLEPSGWPGPRALATSAVPYVLGPLTGGGALPPRDFVDAVLGALPVSPVRALTRGGVRATTVNVLNETLFGNTPVARRLARRAMRSARVVLLATSLSPGALPDGAETMRVPLAGIDLDGFRPAADASRGRRTVLYAGRIVAIKGLHLLIEAVARTGARLRIAGAAPPEEAWYEAHCRARAEALGVTERLTWLGELPRAQLAEEYAAADLTCMLSLWDTYGLTYVESMACGTPVVALATGGAPEIVPAGAGWVIAPTTPEEVVARLSEVLEHALGDPGVTTAAGEVARAHVEQVHAWPALLDRLDEAYARAGVAPAS